MQLSDVRTCREKRRIARRDKKFNDIIDIKVLSTYNEIYKVTRTAANGGALRAGTYNIQRW